MEHPIAYRIIAYIFSIFVFVAIIALSKWRELSQERKLRDLVSWSAIGDYCPAIGRNSYDGELLITVLNAQYNEAIDKKHRIAEETEKQYVREIIEAYQKDIMRSYFKGQLKIIKSKYALFGKDYFMMMLYAFLSAHQCDYKFLGYDMHKERVSYKSYGDSFSSGFEATYSLSEFAEVFHKMHYITYMYCRKNDKLQAFVPEWNEKNLKDILDTHQIQVSRY